MKENKNIEIRIETPSFVYRDGMTTNREYVEWLSDVKARFRHSQIKASIRVNTSMLDFYWSVGRDLVVLRAEESWGAGVVKQFALDMRHAFPDATGFSHTNVKYMKQWYSFYFEQFTKSQQLVGQLGSTEISHQICDQISIFRKSQQVVGQLEMPEEFGVVPWGHHIQIFSRCKSLGEAIFYVNKVSTEGWSRSFLEHQVDSHFFETQGSAISNFDKTLPASQIESAKELLKKEYDLSFITIKEINKEKDLENALANNITQFLLELGKGFSYVGRQMELQMPGGQTFFPDLVFYHIPQHRYIVVELKAVKFIPEYAGKLNFYVTAADKLLRGETDNPSVGLLICKSTDKTIVEWSLQDIQKPLGVATYQLQEVVERTIVEIENRKENV